MELNLNTENKIQQKTCVKTSQTALNMLTTNDKDIVLNEIHRTTIAIDFGINDATFATVID